MEFFKQNTKIRFMGIRKWTYLFSAFIVVTSLVSLLHYGLNFSLEFTGGTEMVVKYDQAQPVDTQLVRHELEGAHIAGAEVETYGSGNRLLIKVKSTQTAAASDDMTSQIKTQVLAALSQGHVAPQVESVSVIGPQIGSELAHKGILAVIVALLLTMFYIAFRFEYRFAVSSTLALIHDPLLILGIFAFFHIEFDLTALAAVLTVIGYSLNDTIVVFDRVRENFRKVRKGTPMEIMNLSINQTLSRTIMTSGLTLIAVVTLFIFGGPVVHAFALAMIVGIVIGTYSSIYVAGALALSMGLTRQDLIPAPKQALDDRP